MTHFNPKRLIEDPAVSGHLRADLQAYSNAPVGYSAEAGLHRLQQQLLTNPSPLGNSASGAGSWGIVGLVSAVGLGLALLGMVPEQSTPDVAAVASLESSQTPASQDDEARPFQPLAPRVLTQPATAAAPTTDTPASGHPLRATSSSHPITHRSPRSRNKPGHKDTSKSVQPPPTDDNPYLREVRQLNRARSKLATSPQEAFALAQRGRSEFPDGALTQEWEGIAILALVQQGRQTEAQTRGKQFLKRYPHGTFAAKVRAATNL